MFQKSFSGTKFLLIGFLFFSELAFGQKLKYEVSLMGNKIGATTVEKKDSTDGFTLYRLRSRSEANLLFTKRKSEMIADVWYRNGELFSSYFRNVKDDELLVTQTLRDKLWYWITKNGQRFQMKKAIRLSSVLLYFEEPKSASEFYSERLGEFFEIQKKGEGVYEAFIDGTNAIYTYGGGELLTLEMKRSVGNILMKKVP